MVFKITSIQNERVKYIRSLARRRARQREGRFVVEGTRLLDEAMRAGLRPALVLYSEEWASGAGASHLLPWLATALEGAWVASDAVVATCADTATPQGVVAVLPFVQIPPRPGLVLIVDRLRDPGNLGTILRSAEAAAAGQVVLSPGTVDPYNPKVVRGAMGAHFRLPLSGMPWARIAKQVAGHAVWLADASGEVSYDAVDWTQLSALIVGGEAEGASTEAVALATNRVSIPMTAGTESLNAAMAATVILFEAARQRRA